MRRNFTPRQGLTPTRLAAAMSAALLMLASPAGHGAIALNGHWWTDPYDSGVLALDYINLPNVRLTVGQALPGSLVVTDQSFVRLAGLNLGNRADAYVALSAGMSLHGAGSRLEIGHNAARATMEVTGGMLNGRADPLACLTNVHRCYAAVGNSAGSDATFTIQSGGYASLLGNLMVGNVHVDTGFGTPGGTTTGRINVLTGGELLTDSVTLGLAQKSSLALGSERSIAIARVEGSGSTWRITGSSYDQGGAYFTMAFGERSTATLELWHGGRLRIEGQAGGEFGAIFGKGGTANVSIRATDFVMTGDAQRGFIDIANGGTATVNLIEAGNIQGGRNMQIGLNGGTGTLNVVGQSGHARPFVQMADGHRIRVGDSGTGYLNVTGGGIVSTAALNIGSGGHGQGFVNLTGSGSVLGLTAVDGHRLSVGEWGEGTLVVSDGAIVDAAQGAEACANRWCGTMIGNGAGSTGRFTVTGAGSKASFLGAFNVGGVGIATQALDGVTFGTLGGTTRATVEVLNGAVLNTQRVGVGGWLSPSGTGSERSFSTLTVRGAGSVWNVLGSELEGGEARIGDDGAMGQSQWRIDQGGQLNISAPAGRSARLALGAKSGSTMVVDGAGSRVAMSGEFTGVGIGFSGADDAQGALVLSNGSALDLQPVQRSWLTIGTNYGSSGELSVLSGSRVTGVGSVTVGEVGGSGSLMVDGAGSRLLIAQPTTDNFTGLHVGRGGQGWAVVSAGGRIEAPLLEIGRDSVGHFAGMLITGKDGQGRPSTLALSGVDYHRLYLGSGELSVAAGGLLDAATNAAACPSTVWCGALIGASAGSTSNFTVTGAGSRASFNSVFQVGRSWVATQALDGYDEGVAGADTFASVKVLNGGRLETSRVAVGLGSSDSGAALGTESSFSSLAIRGAGSVWAVNGAEPGTGDATFTLITPSARGNAVVSMAVSGGGRLAVAAPTGARSFVNIAAAAGTANVNVSGAGSALTMSSDTLSAMTIGNNGGNGSLSFSAGAQFSGASSLTVGNNGSQGRLSFDGAGTAGSLTGYSFTTVGSRDSLGTLNVTNGATLSTDPMATAAFMQIGNGSSSTRGQGGVNLSGAGSKITLHQTGLAADSIYNPSVSVGRNADGLLNISGGAQMRVQGDLPVQTGFLRTTDLTIGNGTLQAGIGTANVSGAGSSLAVTGTNAFITVGTNARGTGQLNISDGALVQTTLMGIADFGATGTTRIDNATLKLSGEWQGTVLPLGASLSVGAGLGSVGVLTLDHGARLQIQNTGAAPTALQLGGYGGNPLGTGVLNVANGARIDVSSASGQGQVFIGHSGTGVATFSSGSALYADYIGVGAVRGADGGAGTLIVNDSVVSATTIEIGVRGYVGGNGTLVGNVINRGVFSPGNSPGTLVIDGSFTNRAGGRLVLEIEADGQGGFKTDHLVFANAAAVDLSGLAISFRFLGQTDPNAFQAGGAFKIDEFFQLQGGGELDHAQFAAVSFSASADAYAINSFSFSADGGASFSATPVPEPGSWMLLLAGLGVLGAAYRMKRDRSSLRASSPSLASTSVAPMLTV